MSPADSVSGASRGWLLALAALLLFAASLCLDTRQNGFPFFYHPDEPDKVDQLITGKWNFHHPLLMLGTAESVKRITNAPDTEQSLVVLGRWCSAALASAGVTFLALLGWRVRGWGGFWTVGLLLLTQHQVYELAHYFKEDTALFMAIALAFLALHIYHRRPASWTALFAGGACGLCLSAKYLGAIMLIPAIVMLVSARRSRRGTLAQWLGFFFGFVAIALAVNWPVFFHLDIFTHSFGRETQLVAHGEKGYTGGQIALFEYLRMFVLNTTPITWVLLVAAIAVQWKRRDAFDWTMAIFPFAFMLMLSCSTKTNDRYFLPATAIFQYLAALGALDLRALLASTPATSSKPLHQALKWAGNPWLLAGIAVAVNLIYLRPYFIGFAHDDRTEMLDWIRANIPGSAVIAGENRADLPIADRPERLAVHPLLPQRVIEIRYAADLGATPEAVAKQGINYLVLSQSDYGIFFRKAATSHLTPELKRKRAFYETLFKNYRPLWQRDRGTVIYLHPGLQVYLLTSR